MDKMTSTHPLVCGTVKAKTVAALLALVCSVALPQFFHLVGAVSGLGSSLGEAFLPMHLPVFLVAFFAGALAGFTVGFSAPIVSFLLTTLLQNPMPALPMLPYMVIELSVYGLLAGLLRSRLPRIPVFFDLLLAQLGGRAVRAIAIVIGVYGLNSSIPVSTIWTSVLTGLIGLLLQWVLVPLLVSYVERREK